MANIPVVQKRSTMWLWIIVAIIVAVVLFALVAMRAGSTTATSPVSDLTSPGIAADRVLA